MKTPAIVRAIWLAGGLALALGGARDALPGLLPAPRELPRQDGATGEPWIAGEFQLGQPAFIDTGLLPPRIQTADSGRDGDEWQGRSETAWFRTSRRLVHVAVAGYPQHPGCRLWAEFQTKDGTVARIDCPIADPRERWNVWEIRRPAGALAVRIVAEDQARDIYGWLAFSHPYRAWPGTVTAAYQGAQIIATIALVLALLWGPGLLWFPRSAGSEIRMVFLLGMGPLLLAAIGLLVWCLGGWIRPVVPGGAGVLTLWLAVGACAHRRGFDLEIAGALRRMLAVSAAIVVAVAAKSSYSAGPEGELFGGTVSRNLTVGDRLDSRYPYHVVQAAVHHLAPASPETEKYFYPWTFFSRGPLAGLVATPIVLATGGSPPAEMPDDRWSPFDPFGFAAYRITMMALGSGIIVALFALLAPLVGERWAVIAGGLLALSPFGVHEVMFTWPKWVATTWLLLSFSLAHARRPGGAGFALALGFYFHPMALLWAPWLAVWAAARCASRSAAVAAALRFAGVAALLVLPWMGLGAWLPHLPDTPYAGQGGFIGYLLVADREAATWQTWWQTRWMNFANTFIPVHVYFSGFNHPRFGSVTEPSGRLVKFALAWWNSLPFGLGLGLWAVSMVALARALRACRAATWLLVIGPAVLITAYWGWDPLGLMRECGHPLFIAVIALTTVVAARSGGWLRRMLLHPAVPWLQLPETWLMLWLTTLANRHRFPVEWSQLDAFYLALNASALLLAACLLARGRQDASHPQAVDRPRLVTLA